MGLLFHCVWCTVYAALQIQRIYLSKLLFTIETSGYNLYAFMWVYYSSLLYRLYESVHLLFNVLRVARVWPPPFRVSFYARCHRSSKKMDANFLNVFVQTFPLLMSIPHFRNIFIPCFLFGRKKNHATLFISLRKSNLIKHYSLNRIFHTRKHNGRRLYLRIRFSRFLFRETNK